MIPIQDVGTLHPQDAEGFLLNDGRPASFPWSHALEGCRDVLRGLEGSNLSSIYVRGSVAQDQARIGVSDIDVVGVTLGPPAAMDVGPLELALEARFPFCTGVELVRIRRDVFLSGPEAAGVRFALAMTGRRLDGEDLLPFLPRYRPGRDCVFYATTLERRLAYYRTAPGDPGLIRWIAKALVRAGFDLVMEREGVYSSQLPVCCERFARHYPAWEKRLREAAACAVNPDPGFRPDELAAFLLAAWAAL